MLKNHLHTAVILATAAVAPLSLEASFKSLFCHTTEDQRTATVQAPAAKTSLKSKLMNCFGRNKTKRATIISAQDNTTNAETDKFLWTQPGSTAHQSQHGRPSRKNTTNSEQHSVTPPPAVKQEEDTGNVTENKAPAAPSPAPVGQTAKVPDQRQNLRLTLFLQNQIDDLPDMPTSTKACGDSIRFSKILEDLNAQAEQLKAELSSLSEASEETQQPTESPEEVSEKDPKKAQFDPVIAQLSQQFADKQQIPENPQN